MAVFDENTEIGTGIVGEGIGRAITEKFEVLFSDILIDGCTHSFA
jgi:hypothetical protein